VVFWQGEDFWVVLHWGEMENTPETHRKKGGEEKREGRKNEKKEKGEKLRSQVKEGRKRKKN